MFRLRYSSLLPVDGIIVVTSPQELVSMIVGKAVRMAEMMDIPVLGLVENMSYLTCPDCGKEIDVFGKSTVADVAKEYGIDVLGRLPIDPKLATACDNGRDRRLRRSLARRCSEEAGEVIVVEGYFPGTIFLQRCILRCCKTRTLTF